jgi:hypothetical protein
MVEKKTSMTQNTTYLSKIFEEECGIALRNSQVVLWSPGLSKARVEKEDGHIHRHREASNNKQASNGSEQLGDEKDDLVDLERLNVPVPPHSHPSLARPHMCLMTTTSNEGDPQQQQQHTSRPDGGHHPRPPGDGGIVVDAEGRRVTNNSSPLPPSSSSTAAGAALVAVDDFGFKYDAHEEDEDDGPARSLSSSLASLEPARVVVASPTTSPEFPRGQGGGDGAGSGDNLAGSTADANDDGAVATNPFAHVDDAALSTTNGKAWPRKGIAKPHPNDVLYGRGGTFLSRLASSQTLDLSGTDSSC